MNTEVIVGNLCSIGATISDSISGTRKNKKEMLIYQSISQIFYIICSVALKGYSATVQNVVAIIRNLFAAFDKKNKYIEIALIIIPLVLGIVFNNRGLVGLLPVAANLSYGICMFSKNQDPDRLKFIFILNIISYTIFNFYILNYVGGIFNTISAISTTISLIKSKNKQ